MNDIYSSKLGGGGGAPTASKLWGQVTLTAPPPPPRFPRPCAVSSGRLAGGGGGGHSSAMAWELSSFGSDTVSVPSLSGQSRGSSYGRRQYGGRRLVSVQFLFVYYHNTGSSSGSSTSSTVPSTYPYLSTLFLILNFLYAIFFCKCGCRMCEQTT